MGNKQWGKFAAWWCFLPIGIALGTAAGAFFGNVGAGISIGAALGTILNLLFYYFGRNTSQR